MNDESMDKLMTDMGYDWGDAVLPLSDPELFATVMILSDVVPERFDKGKMVGITEDHYCAQPFPSVMVSEIIEIIESEDIGDFNKQELLNALAYTKVQLEN
jgi:hypothetical protein